MESKFHEPRFYRRSNLAFQSRVLAKITIGCISFFALTSPSSSAEPATIRIEGDKVDISTPPNSIHNISFDGSALNLYYHWAPASEGKLLGIKITRIYRKEAERLVADESVTKIVSLIKKTREAEYEPPDQERSQFQRYHSFSDRRQGGQWDEINKWHEPSSRDPAAVRRLFKFPPLFPTDEPLYTARVDLYQRNQSNINRVYINLHPINLGEKYQSAFNEIRVDFIDLENRRVDSITLKEEP
tara:strand:+ start:3147 stop:3875 length:729 start_codon:yes stop_codon:yes gene_type:complete